MFPNLIPRLSLFFLSSVLTKIDSIGPGNEVGKHVKPGKIKIYTMTFLKDSRERKQKTNKKPK